MNKKVMAIAMAAIMLMVAVTVGVSAQSDAEGSTPVVGGEKIIMGSVGTPYILYTDQSAGVDRSIEFNESAFSSKKIVSFKVNDQSASLNNVTKIDSSGTVVNSSEAVDVTISSGSSYSSGAGAYTVNIKGVSSSGTNTITITIQVLVQDFVCSDDAHTEVNHHTEDCISLPPQAYDFKAYVKVIYNSGQSISLSGTGVGSNDNKLTFQFEVDANIEAKVVDSSSNGVGGYRFYATGLPQGISMTVEGEIGGKVSNSYSVQGAVRSGTYSVYAVSESGKVL